MKIGHLVRNTGIPALTYTATHPNIRLQCTLKILKGSDLQFTISLEPPGHIHGSGDKQSFVLRFDGNILVPGKSKLECVNIRLPSPLCEQLARHGNSQLNTLFLSLKEPCSLWYPATDDSVASSLKTSAQDLIAIARAIEVYIVFDTKWLGRSNLAELRKAVEGHSQLEGIPVNPHLDYTLSRRQAKLNSVQIAEPTISSSVNDVVSLAVASVGDAVLGAYPSVEEEGLDVLPSVEVMGAPPPYERKRPRNTQSPVDCPDSKRSLQRSTYSLSPTERATSASSTTTVKGDLLQDAITCTVKDVLPDMLGAELPLILAQHLTSLLTRSPSLSPTPHLAKHSRTSSHKKTTPAAHLRDVVMQATGSHLQHFIDDAEARVEDTVVGLTCVATEEIQSILEDHRLDMEQVAEDHKACFNDECQAALDDFKLRVEEELERTEERLERTKERLERTKERLERTEERLERTEERLERTEERLEQTEERLEQTEERLKWTEERVKVTTRGRCDEEERCTCRYKCLQTQKGNQTSRLTSLPIFAMLAAETKQAQPSTHDESCTDDAFSTEDEL